jgi:DNA polymerase alpha subunit A
VHDERKEDSLSGLICIKCKAGIPEQYVMNRVNLFLKQLLVIYYQGNYECQEPSCKAKSRQLLINNRCVVGTCKGKMIPEYSEFVTNDTLRYLQGLFNVRKYIHETKQTTKLESDVINYDEFNRLKSKVDSVLNRSKYNKVDLRNIFSFMTKN